MPSAFTLLSSLPEKHYSSYDQLYLQERRLAHFLGQYSEGPLTFGPTYKFRKYEPVYETQRIPGWTDRIFFHSKYQDMRLVQYTADYEVFGSDHRPVVAQFIARLDLRVPQWGWTYKPVYTINTQAYS